MNFLLFVVIPFIAYLLIPLFLLIRLWFNKTTSLGKWLVETTLFGACIFDLFLIGMWPLTYGHLIRYALVIAFPVFVLKSFFNTKKRLSFVFPGFKSLLSHLVYMGLICFFVVRIVFAVSGSTCPEGAVDLGFPLKGKRFCVAHGGSHHVVNHHTFVRAQRYALDITSTNAYGLRACSLFPSRLEHYFIYETEVYSPCDGTVIKVVDGHENQAPREMNPENPAGNCLAIKKGDSEIVIVLAHLLKDSITVKEGDEVEEGQVVARIGNSGNTSEPHLHIHAVIQREGEDLLFEGEGIPITFNKRFLVRNDYF